MKHLLLLLTLIVGFVSLPTPSFAKDKYRDSDKDLRNDLNALQSHYDIVKDRVKYMTSDRRLWGNLQDIRRNIDAINDQYRNGRYDGRDVRDQIRRANDDLSRLQSQIDRSISKGNYRN